MIDEVRQTDGSIVSVDSLTILQCASCGKRCSAVEAMYRKFNRGLCGCGGMLDRVGTFVLTEALP